MYILLLQTNKKGNHTMTIIKTDSNQQTKEIKGFPTYGSLIRWLLNNDFIFSSIKVNQQEQKVNISFANTSIRYEVTKLNTLHIQEWGQQ